jgi:hypothetical protein
LLLGVKMGGPDRINGSTSCTVGRSPMGVDGCVVGKSDVSIVGLEGDGSRTIRDGLFLFAVTGGWLGGWLGCGVWDVAD